MPAWIDLNIDRAATLYRHKASLSSIADKFGVSRQTITRRLQKRGIFCHGNQGQPTGNAVVRARATYRDHDWLYNQYWDMDKSYSVIARECGVCPQTICDWMDKLEIAPRSSAWAQHLARGNELDISPYLLSLLEGELLGDGHLGEGSRECCTALYRHTSKYKEYLIWLSEEFAGQGLEQAGKIKSTIARKDDHPSVIYGYATRIYPALGALHKRFYPNGEKIVPKDLVLNPISTRQWYIGDGGFQRPKRDGRAAISLATNSFNKASISILIKQLKSAGIEATHQPARNVTYIPRRAVIDFLSYIGPCPKVIESIYGYKWAY